MFNLKDHPFAVEAFFKSSVVITYAVPKDNLTALLPECLTPDTFDERWGFVAVALVDTKGLRPKGFPAFIGNDFVLTGYRIFVRYTTSQGKRLRGLYILKSETNKKRMAFFGNLFTHYQYTTTDIHFTETPSNISVRSKKSDLNIEVRLSDGEASLPQHSPFANWKEARRFAGPLPFTFTYDAETKQVLLIEGVREAWVPRPVDVLASGIGFLKQPAFQDSILANAFVIQNIPYYWKKGRVDLWKG